MDTEQFNLRVSKSIIFDLEFIERASGISKNDWVRYTLAKEIKKAKEELLINVEKEFMHARIEAHEFKAITGYTPSETLFRGRRDYGKRVSLLLSTDYEQFTRKALGVPESRGKTDISKLSK